MRVNGLPIPTRLLALLETGGWPATWAVSTRMEAKPVFAASQIERVAAGEAKIVLYPPPFRTVGSLSRNGEEFWTDPIAAPDEIDFEESIPIGDFGLGSDAPLLLDYRANIERPSVLRLAWSSGGEGNHWVVAAADFEEFSLLLGLSPGLFERW